MLEAESCESSSLVPPGPLFCPLVAALMPLIVASVAFWSGFYDDCAVVCHSFLISIAKTLMFISKETLLS